MKILLLCLLAFCLIDAKAAYYRYKDGTLTFNKQQAKVSGFFLVDKSKSMAMLSAMDFSTMTAHTVAVIKISGESISNLVITRIGGMIAWNNNMDLHEGTMKFTETAGEVVLTMNCKGSKGYTWTFSLKGKQSQKLFYDYKEAGSRARKFLGASTSFFKGAAIIGYATMDISHIFKNCERAAKDFRYSGNQAKPGYIIMGKNLKHCGIVDNEGDKFVHDNPKTLKVEDTPLVLASQFFPDGYYFMQYPEMASVNLFKL